MAITTRSARDPCFKFSGTSAGPGAYDIQKDHRWRPSFAGFLTSDQRDLNAVKTTLAETPGPGAYGGDHFLDRESLNSAMGKNKRNAAFGKTLGKAKSNVVLDASPGPGAYTGTVCASAPPRTHVNRRRKKPGDPILFIQAAYNPPAIPHRRVNYGYDRDDRGRVMPVKIPAGECYTGIGPDTVGPAAYSPQVRTVRPASSSCAFSRYRGKRMQWVHHPGEPGPGEYYHDGGGGEGADKHGGPFSAGARLDGTASFRSGTERRWLDKMICRVGETGTDVGPGKYDVASTVTAKPRAGRAAPFTTTSYRVGILTENKKVPGPGTYDCTQLYGLLKKAQPRLHNDPTGFGTASRPCLKSPKDAAPGPCAYDQSVSTIGGELSRKMAAAAAAPAIASFGSSSQRFRELPDVVDESLFYVEDPYNPVPVDFREPQSSDVVRRKVKLANFREPSFRGPRVVPPSGVAESLAPAVERMEHRVDQSEAPAVGTLYIQQEPASENMVQSREPRVKASFLSTSTRFAPHIFVGEKISEAPGPGSYDTQKLVVVPPARRASHAHPTLPQDGRFKCSHQEYAPVSVQERGVLPGPGMYYKPGSMVTNTFNVTFKKKDRRGGRGTRATGCGAEMVTGTGAPALAVWSDALKRAIGGIQAKAA